MVKDEAGVMPVVINGFPVVAYAPHSPKEPIGIVIVDRGADATFRN